MKDHHFDIAIAAGGLAGLCLSIQMARGGYKVLLCEKERYPFHKVCGEYIAMESWKFLESLGVPLTDLRLPIIKRLQISDCNGKLLKHQLSPGGFGISRFTLEATLADIARSLNVTLLEQTKVTDINYELNSHSIKTTSGSFKATIVSGSWGKRSNLDIKLNRPFVQPNPSQNTHYIAVKYHIETNFPDDLIELHNFNNGYCGISKVDNDPFCLCYLTTAQNLQQNQNSIPKLEENILAKNPQLRNYFTQSRFLYEDPLTISQLNFTRREVVNDHIFMIGDAGGLITPLCGNGMSMAMHASKFLAEIANEFLKKRITRDQAERLYQETWHHHFNKRLKAGRVFQGLFGKPSVTNAAVGILRQFPTLTNKLVRLTHGDTF